MKNFEWKLIGQVGVDSGQLMICDPCYIDKEWKRDTKCDFSNKSKGKFSYNGCCNGTLDKNFAQLNFKLGHPGAGVAFSSELGDGLYDVFAKFRTLKYWGRRITEIKIKLI